MKKLLVLLALSLGFASTSYADLMIEPYLGYEMGSGSVSNNDFDTDGVVMGARLGYKTPLMLWFALDAALGVSGNYKPDSGSSETAKRTTYSLVAGLDFPILVRGWVGYGFTNKITADDSGDISGTNTKIGVSFTGLPFICLNLEYIMDKFDEVDGTEMDVDHTGYMLSVSLPLSF